MTVAERHQRPKQSDRLIQYLRTHRTITSREAMEFLGIERLAARVSELRSQGVAIKSRTIRVKNMFGEECRISQYWLEEDEPGELS